jgi:hypothetical protein
VSTPADGERDAASGRTGPAETAGSGGAWTDADPAGADPAAVQGSWAGADPARADPAAATEYGSAGGRAAAAAGDEVGEPVPAELVRLAAAVAALDEIAGLPVAEHVPRYDALHGELSDALASIDEV